jgi:predicted amidophosphoribosyltransferase
MQAETTADSTFARKCPDCDGALDADQECTNCGAEWDELPETCPTCGADLEGDTCPTCGDDLIEEDEPAPKSEGGNG